MNNERKNSGKPGCYWQYLLAVLLIAAVCVCGWLFTRASAEDERRWLPGGATSVEVSRRPSYMLPAANLPAELKSYFYAGKALAGQPWIKAPTATNSRDGLGPVFNARSCLVCHINGGRGEVPSGPEQPIFSALLRLSLPGVDSKTGAIPEPMYGNQLQPQSTSLASQLGLALDAANAHLNQPPAEGQVAIHWQDKVFTYPDGEQRTLRYPEIRLHTLGYGAMHADVQMSLRNSPPLHGMGLLEAIAYADMLAQADPEDRDGDGISGRINRVWDIQRQQTVAGRFGWKASQPTVRQQTAAAFLNDVGITSSLFPHQPCTAQQAACLAEPTGDEWDAASQTRVELADNMLELSTLFTRNLAVPRRRKVQEQQREHLSAGRSLFHQVGCASCHHPHYITGTQVDAPHLSAQAIWPYTDLLLHDMGEELADGRSDFLATGSEWRTPPLWGIGWREKVNGRGQLLHDGRARSIEEAVLWHGGEARQSREAFTQLDLAQRNLLLQFVESL